VVSACSKSQLIHLQVHKNAGKYHWIVFPDLSLQISQLKVFSNRLINGIINRIFHAPNLFSTIYLHLACKKVRALSPDIILINDQAQYIRFVRARFPEVKVGLFVRSEMSGSRKYLPLLDLIITNSDGISDYVRNLLNDAPVPISKIPNSLETSFCQTPKKYMGGKRIIYAGRMVAIKGVLELLCEFALVQKQLPDAQLTLLGGNFNDPDTKSFENQLLEEAKANHLNVQFISQIPNSALPFYYQQADLAVFPSLCKESFGMVALEAMRCGLPVVASRRPGFEEVIVNSETGIIIDDPTDVNSIADVIINLLNNPELSKKMGEEGYLRSLEFTPQMANQKFAEVLRKHL
jgi:glycosyltransferase involved in cell wall biosynthesis